MGDTMTTELNRTNIALAALNSWFNSALKLKGDEFMPTNTYIKFKTYGVIWHDRILLNRSTFEKLQPR